MSCAAHWQGVHQLRMRALDALGAAFALRDFLQRLQEELGHLQVPFAAGPLEDCCDLAFQASLGIQSCQRCAPQTEVPLAPRCSLDRSCTESLMTNL